MRFAPPPPPVRLLAYADDLLAFLSTPDELTTLQHLLRTYQLASNGKVNINKSVAVSLPGLGI